MKSLQEYIDRYEVNYDNPRFWATTERLSIDCEDLFGNVPATSKEIFCNTCNMIEETLIMSHSSAKLQNELQKIFSNLKFEDIVGKTKNDDAKSFKAIFDNEKDAQQFYNPSKKSEIGKKIIILMNFFNYKSSSKSKNIVEVEPVFSKKANDIVRKNHGIMYHLCDKKFTEKILKEGLRCKNNMYRAIPSRIYLYCCVDIRKNKNDFMDFLKELKYDLSECDLLKINIMNDEMIKFHNVSNFYVDDNMESKNAIYTYNNIRASCIKKINLNTIIYEGLTILENNDDSPLQKFFNKHGIVPEKISSDSKVNQIGFSEKEQAWYGWSHRAIYGFKIGAKAGPGKVGYETLKQENGPLEAKTLDDCKKMAIAFAKEIS